MGAMTRGEPPLVRITVTGPDGRDVVQCAEPYSPYLLETIVEHARGGGAAARTEVTFPSAADEDMLVAIEDALARRRGPRLGVRVVREGTHPRYTGMEQSAMRADAAASDERRVSEEAPPPDAPPLVGEGLQLALIVRIGRVLHELQRERAYAAAHSASAYRLFTVERGLQERHTDAAVAELRAFVSGRSGELPAPLLDSAAVALQSLDNLPSIRVRVTTSGLSSAAVIDAYRPRVSSLLAVVHTAAAIERDAELARMALAYIAFLNAKEQAGRECAEVASAWAVDGLEPDPLAVECAIAEQSAFLRMFEMAASPTVVDAFRLRATEPAWEAVAAMERLARGRHTAGGSHPDAATWFECMTAKLDALRQVEDMQLETMLRRATLSRRH